MLADGAQIKVADIWFNEEETNIEDSWPSINFEIKNDQNQMLI